ncbi:MAG TPA: hypothetical protein VF286_14310, partial [Acidiphilium sp.]
MAAISGPDRTRRGRETPLLAGTALLFLWPALVNGFPLIFSDTGTYVSQAMELHLGWDRPPYYSFFLLALDWGRTLWPPVIVQCVGVAWLIRRVQKAIFPGSGWRAGVALMSPLAAATSLPWVATQAMPDIFTPMMVLALAILTLDAECGRLERLVLIAVIAFAIAAHLSNLPIYAGLCLAVLLPRAILFRRSVPWFAVLAPLVAGACALIGVNLVATGRITLSPYGSTFVLARLLADGPARVTLARDCAGMNWALCRYRSDLPKTADGFLWRADSPLYRAGGPVRLIDDTDAIVRRTLRAEPGAVTRDAARDFLHQFVLFDPGSGLRPWRATAGATIRRDFVPGAVARFDRSLQARGTMRIPFVLLILDRIVAWLGIAITAGFAGVAAVRRRRATARLAVFAAIVLAALLGNAAVTGALSGPHDRYQCRVVWLAVLAAGLCLQSLFRPTLAADQQNHVGTEAGEAE